MVQALIKLLLDQISQHPIGRSIYMTNFRVSMGGIYYN